MLSSKPIRRSLASSKVSHMPITKQTLTTQSIQPCNPIQANICQNLLSIQQTIQMLSQYEKLCIEKQDFLSAEETKNKMDYLLGQAKSIHKESKVLIDQQNKENVCKEGQDQIRQFQQHWDTQIKMLMTQLKQIEANAMRLHQQQLQQYKLKLMQQQPTKIKYSAKVLELRKNLTNLIKARKYKQADQTKNKLKDLQIECQQSWNAKHLEKLQGLLEKVQKKQNYQLKALRVKLEGIFNQKIKQRDEKFQILLKRNRKRRIQSSKTTVHKMGQSINMKSRSQSRVLGQSKMSNFNISKKN